jgi:hypothetical protein
MGINVTFIFAHTAKDCDAYKIVMYITIISSLCNDKRVNCSRVLFMCFYLVQSLTML